MKPFFRLHLPGLQAYGTDDLVPEWDMLGQTGHGTGRSNGFFQFTQEVALTMDMTGTAPAITYPLPGGGDVPPFPPPPPPSELSLSSSEDPLYLEADHLSALSGLEDLSLDPSKAPEFSRIFYEKGACVNRMVATHVGWDQWNKALGGHLNRFPWSNPTVEDLMHRSLPTIARTVPTNSPHSTTIIP